MCLSQRTKIFTFSQILSMLLIFIIKNLIHLCKVLLLTERDMKQLLFTLLAFFIYTGCTENRIASKQENTYPNIFPDYKEISIPINIAPLNFTVKHSSHIKAVFSNNNQPLFSIEGKNKIDIPLKKWRHIISHNIGKTNRYIHIYLEQFLSGRCTIQIFSYLYYHRLYRSIYRLPTGRAWLRIMARNGYTTKSLKLFQRRDYHFQ